jgi:hypothetical protein
MTKDAALNLALDALELANINHWWGSSKIEAAITAIKEALAQPEERKKSLEDTLNEYGLVAIGYTERGELLTQKKVQPPVPVQESKREWVGLTEEEVIEISHLALTRVQAVQMTTAKLKEKNT